MTRTAEKTSMQWQPPRVEFGDEPAWLRELRAGAWEKSEQLGPPHQKQEHYRFTNFTPLLKTQFVPAGPAGVDAARLAEHSLGDQAVAELVFVNGRLSRQLSRVDRQAGGLLVGSLGQSASDGLALVERNLGQHPEALATPFAALNTASFADGAVVHLACGTSLDRPIHLLFLASGGAQPTLNHPRVLIVAEDGASASVVETYAGVVDSLYHTNALTEIALGRDARLEHCRLQREEVQAFHTGATYASLSAGSTLLSHSVALGAALARLDLSVTLAGEHAEATLNGLTVIGGRQHVDHHTTLDHAAAHCPSHELYKYVLDGQSGGVFKGQIMVRPGAQKTDSKQTSRTLLLSDDAMMNSMPALEIHADDVKCTHGSTTGPVDDEQVFYLRSRGVDLAAARHLLTYAFAAEVIDRINIRPVRQRLEGTLAARHNLPRDLRITEGDQ
jgi:Fe-S cluster assembly protein SufD